MPETEKGALNRWFIRYIIALVAIALAFLCRQGMVRYLGAELPPYITFYPTVMLVAVLAGLWAGLLSTAVAALVAAYWILPPEGFAIGQLHDVVGLVLFSGMGALISLVAELYRRARRKAAAYDKELALRETLEQLRESEVRYRSLFENMLEGYAHCQMALEHGEPQDFTYLDVNKAFERLTGLKDVVGRRVSEIIPGFRESNHELFDVYARVAESGEPERLETFVQSLGIWFSIAVYSPRKDHFVAIFDNITERKRAEETLRLHAAALESAANSIVITDREGRILWINPAFERLTGYSAEEVLGQNPRLLRSGKQDTAFYRELWETILAGRPWRGELINRRKDGSLFDEEQLITPVRDQKGEITHFVGIKQDITERKRAEEEISKLNAELEQRVVDRTAELAATNKELEAFTYSVSHDLRSPLRHIAGFSQLLLEDHRSEISPEAQRYLGRICEGTRQMGRLIDDLLNLARVSREELKLQATGLRSVVEEVIAALQQDNRQQDIEWRIQALPFVNCDPALMKQVFANLLSNAVKFTRQREHPVVEVGAMHCLSTPVISVRDNGVGFSMKYADKLFGVFQRLHRSEDFEGTGVGLATVQRIIHKHGGRVWARAELDKGATFYFTVEQMDRAEWERIRSAGGDL